MNNIVPIILCTQKNINSLVPYLELAIHFPKKTYVVVELSRQFEVLALIEKYQANQNIELILLPECRGNAPAAAVSAFLLNKQAPDAHAFILDSAIGDQNFDGLLNLAYQLAHDSQHQQLTQICTDENLDKDLTRQPCHYFATNNSFLGLLKILQLSCYLCASRCCDLVQQNAELSCKRYYLPQHVYRQGLVMNLVDAMRHGGSCIDTVSYCNASSNVLESAA